MCVCVCVYTCVCYVCVPPLHLSSPHREGRVMGQLEVSRSIGDGPYKNHGVSSVPDVRRCVLGDNDRCGARLHRDTHILAHTHTHRHTHTHTHTHTHAHTHTHTLSLTMRSLDYSLTHSHTHSLTHSLTHLLTRSLTHSLSLSLTHSLTLSPHTHCLSVCRLVGRSHSLALLYLSRDLLSLLLFSPTHKHSPL